MSSHRHIPLVLLATVVGCLATSRGPVLSAEPTFLNDVMAVLSQSGCNLGTCHGNQNGKGGFKLSLRGQDPQADYRRLARELATRRIDLLQPQESLILQKPTGRLAHGGGVRFNVDSAPYQVLRSWIDAGAPGPSAATPRLQRLHVSPSESIVIDPQAELALQVTAVFDDGSQRDVTGSAVYEASSLVATVTPEGRIRRTDFGQTTVIVRYLDQQVPVRLAFIPERANFAWREPTHNNYVDRHVFRRLRQLRMTPSDLCSDDVFVRRAFLDALGILPTAAEARRFVNSDQPDKRAQLVDQLLSREEFSEHWTLKWSDVLRIEEKVLDTKGVEAFHQWILDSIAKSKPTDQFVRELVTGKGSTYDNPPANFYRVNRDPTARGETAARLFLGVRLQCARCHNHPFDRWTQDDYYAWSAVFARIDYKIVDNKRPDKFDKNQFVGEQIVMFTDKGEVKNAASGKVAAPRLLGESTPVDDKHGRLESLADWLTSGDNRQFARRQVNWIWYHVMGRGLVEPLDDFRATNPPIHPELLEALADDFVQHGFDLRHVVRTIMNSRTYQLSAMPNESNREDQVNFSRAIVRRLTAEQLLDAQCRVLGTAPEFAGYDSGIRAGQVPGVRKVRRRSQPPESGDRFLAMFGKPERLLGCECERSNETTLSQAFLLIGGELDQQLTRPGNRLEKLAQAKLSDTELVEQLYWAALSRAPNESELSAALRLFDRQDSLTDETNRAWARLFNSAGLMEYREPRLAATQDLAWALLNAKEFIFRR